MKKGFLLTVGAVFSAGMLYAANFWPNGGMEEGKGSVPLKYVKGGTDQSLLCWGAPAATGEKAIGVVDNSPGGFGNWLSAPVKLPEGLAGKSIRFCWSERYNVLAGVMRVTITFYDESNALIKSGTANHLLKGKSAGWDSGVYSPVNLNVNVPAEAAVVRISLMSAGTAEATGEVWMDDLSAEPVESGK